jgi:hypothetical protein
VLVEKKKINAFSGIWKTGCYKIPAARSFLFISNQNYANWPLSITQSIYIHHIIYAGVGVQTPNTQLIHHKGAILVIRLPNKKIIYINWRL